jgi:hypothetical protein
VDFVLPGQDAWEDIIDPTFNHVIGFGMSTPEIAALIRRGEYEMDNSMHRTIGHPIISSRNQVRTGHACHGSRVRLNICVIYFGSETPTIKATSQKAVSQ